VVSQDSFEETEQTDKPRLELPHILWLIALGLIILFVPLYFWGVSLQDDVASLQGQLVPLQTAQASTPTPESVTGQIGSLTAVSTTLAANNVNWPAAMNVIRAYNPQQITLTGMTQSDNQLFISGEAANDEIVVAYARDLEASGVFKRVLVQSIVVVNLPPNAEPEQTLPAAPASTATPTNTPTPTITSTPMPTATATPDLRDKFEWDDTVAKPIYLNDTQSHNFYPTFDVDHVSFLAKAGLTYRIYTLNLAAGVDTFLTVTQGEMTLTNDDAMVGTLASQVFYTAPSDADVTVLVRITNRGPYGADKTYQVRVEGVVPTATPTVSTSTPTMTPLPPTATNTAVFTPTPTPENTPTATPDMRDAFEPDDPQPAPIGVGDIQQHNFYPNGDVDHLTFEVAGNRVYELVTNELANGVDTSMRVSLASSVWENDDYAPPESGNAASAICFATTPEQGGNMALATIENVSQQFAPDKSYAVSLFERPKVQPDVASLQFSLPANAATPLTQTISISATQMVSVTAVTSTPWLTVSPAAGSVPSTVSVSANSSELAVGTYEGTVTIQWATACQRDIDVTLDVTASESSLETNGAVSEKSAATLLRRQQTGPVEFVIVVDLHD
jgi:Tfp pilus assembly protein PilN